MKIDNVKFYEIFNSHYFGNTIETIINIRRMQKLGLLELNEFQELKVNEYFDIAIRTK